MEKAYLKKNNLIAKRQNTQKKKYNTPTVAYSHETGGFVDARTARKLYKQGQIKDPRAFQCPTEGCSAKTTCVNIDKDPFKSRMDVHFRVYGNHAAYCCYTKSTKNTKNKTSSKEKRIERFYPVPIVECFEPHADQESSETNGGERGCSSGTDRVYRLVDVFTTLRKEESESSTYIEIDGKYRSYQDLFKCIYNQRIRNIPDEFYIYWTSALVSYQKRNKRYMVSFKNELQVEDNKYVHPRIYINEDDIEKSLNVNLRRILLSVKEEGQQSIWGFVYAQPKVVHSGGSKTIEFEVASLLHIDIRSDDFYHELYPPEVGTSVGNKEINKGEK